VGDELHTNPSTFMQKPQQRLEAHRMTESTGSKPKTKIEPKRADAIP